MTTLSFPLVTVVTPSYNQAPFLGETIASVLDQDYPHIEYIVMDGGSTDGSVDIIRAYADRIAYWVSQPDEGQADAISRGWQRSHGEILAWLNSDDTYEPGAVSAVVTAFRDHPDADVITGDCRVINENNILVKHLPSSPFSIKALLSGNSLPQQGVFCRREVVERAGGINTSLRYVFDWELWLRLGLQGSSFVHLPQPLANFRLWGESKTSTETVGESLSGGIRFAQERCQVLEALSRSSQCTPDSPLYQAWLSCLLEIGLLYQLSGDGKETTNYLLRFARAVSMPVREFPYSQTLAAHLAYLDKGIDGSIRHFISSLIAVHPHFSISASRIVRLIRAETYLVQAWEAAHRQENGTAVGHFFQAMRINPRLMFQRRVLSPIVKRLAAWLVSK